MYQEKIIIYSPLILGKGVLQNNFELKIDFVENKVSHKKKENNSYNARHLRKKERRHLGKELENVAYPSKKFQSYLADDKKTNMETGCLSVKSKNVFRQANYEKLPDEDIFKSLEIFKNYKDQSKSKQIKGYIQLLNKFSLLVGLWKEEDVKFYHEMVKQYPVIVDATCGITSKVNESRVLYYAFILYNRSIKTVPFLEVLND